MRNFTFRTPTEADIATLAANMRESDRREVKRGSGMDVETILRRSIANSSVCYSGVFEDGKLACIFGAIEESLMGDTAILWGLSTEDVNTHKMEYWAGSKQGLSMIMQSLPHIAEFTNYMDMEYTAAVRWIERLGASFSMTTPPRRGRCGGIFKLFVIANEHYRKED